MVPYNAMNGWREQALMPFDYSASRASTDTTYDKHGRRKTHLYDSLYDRHRDRHIGNQGRFIENEHIFPFAVNPYP